MDDHRTSNQYEEPEQPMQSIDEIMQILAEATIPAAGTRGLNQYLADGLGIDDDDDMEDLDSDLDVDSSGEMIYAIHLRTTENVGRSIEKPKPERPPRHTIFTGMPSSSAVSLAELPRRRGATIRWGGDREVRPRGGGGSRSGEAVAAADSGPQPPSVPGPVEQRVGPQQGGPQPKPHFLGGSGAAPEPQPQAEPEAGPAGEERLVQPQEPCLDRAAGDQRTVDGRWWHVGGGHEVRRRRGLWRGEGRQGETGPQGGRGGGRRGGAETLAGGAADGHVAERAAEGPVPAARLAEVAGLRHVVVVVVAELGVPRLAPRAPLLRCSLHRRQLSLRRTPPSLARLHRHPAFPSTSHAAVSCVSTMYICGGLIARSQGFRVAKLAMLIYIDREGESSGKVR
ncbi:hypothetical protein BHE74_00002814 [Ensete ventricosum]|nr:hypothetical protein BHE74_00002814 [Ensete ventricosum]